MDAAALHGLLERLDWPLARWRAPSLAPALLLGLAIGARCFDPRRQQLYRRFTLGLRLTLCAVGAGRLLLG